MTCCQRIPHWKFPEGFSQCETGGERAAQVIFQTVNTTLEDTIYHPLPALVEGVELVVGVVPPSEMPQVQSREEARHPSRDSLARGSERVVKARTVVTGSTGGDTSSSHQPMPNRGLPGSTGIDRRPVAAAMEAPMTNIVLILGE